MRYVHYGILPLGFLAAGVLLGGCDRRQQAAPPAPTTQVVIPTTQASPATQAARPEPATFAINGQTFTFPPAKLVLKKTDDGVQATLFSDDPPEALKDDYTGNSFYFNVTLETDDATKVAGQRFVFRNSAADRPYSTTGIFIAGNKQVLQPLTAAVGFDVVDGAIVAYVGGTFQLFDNQAADTTPAPMVTVQAQMQPQRVDKRD